MSSDKLIRRTFTLRPDQDRAMAISLALGTDPNGKDKSAIIRDLLDKHGYCSDSAVVTRCEEK